MYIYIYTYTYTYIYIYIYIHTCGACALRRTAAAWLHILATPDRTGADCGRRPAVPGLIAAIPRMTIYIYI